MELAQLVPRVDRSGDHTGPYSEGWAWVRVQGEFSPDLIEARPGERLRLVFRREETAPCSERVVVPSLGKSVMLPPFEDVTVDLGPLAPGVHEFRCELGVLRGRIVVGDPDGHASLGVAGGRIVVRGRDRAQLGGEHGARPALDADGAGSRRSYVTSENGNREEVTEMKRPVVNITPAERLGRVFVGLVGLVGGLILLGSAGGAVVAVLEVLLVLAGLDLIVTGALGHCPLYHKLGYVPPSLRRPA